MDSTRYKPHFYSRLPQFQSGNDFTEPMVIDAVVALEKAFDNEINHHLSDDEIRSSKEAILNGRNQGVYILVEEIATKRIVAVGSLVKGIGYLEHGENVGMLGSAYVLPEYRRQRIYDSMIAGREKAALLIGYDKLVVEPADDGLSREVLIKRGYQPLYEDAHEVALIKTLQSGDEEREPSIEVKPPGFKK